MLYREIIAVCSQIHTKHINTLCGQIVEFVNVKPGDKQSWALRVLYVDYCYRNSKPSSPPVPIVPSDWRMIHVGI